MSVYNRHAYLILAHSSPNQLSKLIHLLDDSRNDIYIHIDKKRKSLFDKYQISTEKATLHVFSEYSLHWGGFSIVKAELFLLARAVESKHSFYHLLSGEDLPLKSNDVIYNFFEKNSEKEFILFHSGFLDSETYQRVMYYQPLREYSRISKNERINSRIRAVGKAILLFQKTLGLKRNKYYSIFRRGSQWVSVTEDLALTVLADKDKIYHDLKMTFAPDELVFQIVAMNHEEYIERLYHADEYDSCIQNMRLIDWKRGRPYVFRMKDFDDVVNSPYLFGRKFVEGVDASIINAVCDFIEKENKKSWI